MYLISNKTKIMILYNKYVQITCKLNNTHNIIIIHRSVSERGMPLGTTTKSFAHGPRRQMNVITTTLKSQTIVCVEIVHYHRQHERKKKKN